jgi:hypothetical protein
MSCGCNDSPLPLGNCNDGCADCPPSNATNLPPCIGGEACDEVSFSDCVKFVGPNLPALKITNGDRLITVLTKLHRVLNGLISPTIPLASHVATATVTNPVTTTPFVVSYLGLGPVYTSTAGATSSGATITVGSTTNLVAGMLLEVTSGVGAFAANSTVLSVPTLTTFVASAVPTTALSGGATVITATGSEHRIFNISVVQGTPKAFKAFVGSPITVSGTGTIV